VQFLQLQLVEDLYLIKCLSVSKNDGANGFHEMSGYGVLVGYKHTPLAAASLTRVHCNI